MSRASRVLWGLLAVAGAPWAAEGPETVPEATPFSALYLQMPAPLGDGLKPGELSARLNVSHSNVFIYSDEPALYLQARNRREPLTAADADALFARTADDFYYLDGEYSELHLWLEWGLAPGWSAFVDVHGTGQSGGAFDGLIEDFHKAFDFGNDRRELVARHRFQAVLRLDGDEVVVLEPEKRAGWSDPVFGLRYGGWRSGDWRFEALAAVKPGWVSPSYFQASGGTDWGVQLAASWDGRHSRWYLIGGYVELGDNELFPGSWRSQRIYGRVAYEYRWAPGVSIHVSASGYQSPFDPGVVRENLSDESFQATLALRVSDGDGYYSLGLTENLFNLDQSADLSLHFSVGSRF